MKLVNKSGKEQDIVLNMFKFDVPLSDPGTSLVSLSDRNLKTVYRADKPLDVVVPNLDNPRASKVVVVGSAAFAIQARRGEGAWTPVGKRNAGPGVSEFAIPAGTSAVRLTYKAPQPDAIINEVIFPPGNNRLRRWRLTPNSVRNEPGGVFFERAGRAACGLFPETEADASFLRFGRLLRKQP